MGLCIYVVPCKSTSPIHPVFGMPYAVDDGPCGLVSFVRFGRFQVRPLAEDDLHSVLTSINCETAAFPAEFEF